MFKFFLLPIVGAFVLAFFGLASLHKFAKRAVLMIGTIELVMVVVIAYAIDQGLNPLLVLAILLFGIAMIVIAIWSALFASIGTQEVIPAKVIEDTYVELSDDQKKVVYAGLKFAAKVGSAFLADHLKKGGHVGTSAAFAQASKKL